MQLELVNMLVGFMAGAGPSAVGPVRLAFVCVFEGSEPGRVQLQAVVFGYARRYHLKPQQRTAVGLAAAPQDVRDAFEELQRVEAALRECEVA